LVEVLVLELVPNSDGVETNPANEGSICIFDCWFLGWLGVGDKLLNEGLLSPTNFLHVQNKGEEIMHHREEDLK
jgi:hypothetical protein